MRQPGGALSRMRRSPSGVRAQFFDFAARSTTRVRTSFSESAAMHAQHVLTRQQLVAGGFELDCRTDEPKLEGAVVGMIERLMRDDCKPLDGKRVAQVLDRGAWSAFYGQMDDAANAPDLVLDASQPCENDCDQGARAGRLDIEAGADGDAECRDHPDGRGGREARHHAAALHDRAGPEEADAGHDLCGEPRRIAETYSPDVSDRK